MPCMLRLLCRSLCGCKQGRWQRGKRGKRKKLQKHRSCKFVFSSEMDVNPSQLFRVTICSPCSFLSLAIPLKSAYVFFVFFCRAGKQPRSQTDATYHEKGLVSFPRIISVHPTTYKPKCRCFLRHGSLDQTFSTNGTIIKNEEFGPVLQLQGDQRNNVFDFLTKCKIKEASQIKIFGF